MNKNTKTHEPNLSYLMVELIAYQLISLVMKSRILSRDSFVILAMVALEMIEIVWRNTKFSQNQKNSSKSSFQPKEKNIEKKEKRPVLFLYFLGFKILIWHLLIIFTSEDVESKLIFVCCCLHVICITLKKTLKGMKQLMTGLVCLILFLIFVMYTIDGYNVDFKSNWTSVLHFMMVEYISSYSSTLFSRKQISDSMREKVGKKNSTENEEKCANSLPSHCSLAGQASTILQRKEINSCSTVASPFVFPKTFNFEKTIPKTESQSKINSTPDNDIHIVKKMNSAQHEILPCKQCKAYEQFLKSYPEAIIIINSSNEVIYKNMAAYSLLPLAEENTTFPKIAEEFVDSAEKNCTLLKDINQVHEDTKISMKKMPQDISPQFSSLRLNSEKIVWVKQYIRNSIQSPPKRRTQFQLQKIYEVIISNVSFLIQEDNTIIIILKEITEKAILEETKIEEQIKSILISTISHELRTPLNGIIGIHSYLQDMLPPELIKYFKIAQISSLLLLNTVNCMFDYSQIEDTSFKLHITKFKISELLHELQDLFRFQMMRKKLDFIIESNHPDLVIFSDFERIKQVIINLLSNAVGYTLKGYVRLSCNLITNDELEFAVEDSGIGMTKKEIQALFILFGSPKCFSQSERKHTKLAGFGLTISQMIMNKMGSQIDVESQEGIGSKFFFKIEDQAKLFENESIHSELSPHLRIFTNYGDKKKSRRRSSLNSELGVHISSIPNARTKKKRSISDNKLFLCPPKFQCARRPSKFAPKARKKSANYSPKKINCRSPNRKRKIKHEFLSVPKRNSISSLDSSSSPSQSENPGRNDSFSDFDFSNSSPIKIVDQEILQQFTLIPRPEENNEISYSIPTEMNCEEEATIVNTMLKQIPIKESSISSKYKKTPTIKNFTPKKKKISRDSITSVFFADSSKLGSFSRENQSTKILVVDDNEINRLVLTRLLKKAKLEYAEAINGKEACGLVMERNSEFGLIFMDINMPIMGGIEAAEKITTFYKTVLSKDPPPIVAVTAYASEKEKDKCKKVGMVEFLPKPVTIKSIKRVLDDHLNYGD